MWSGDARGAAANGGADVCGETLAAMARASRAARSRLSLMSEQTTLPRADSFIAEPRIGDEAIGGAVQSARRCDTSARAGLLSYLFNKLTRWRIMLLTQLLDAVVIVVIALLVYPITGKSHGLIFSFNYLLGAGMVAVVAHFSFYQAGLYEIDALLNPPRAIKSLSLRWTAVFMMLAAFAALVHVPNLFSRLWFAGFYVGGVAGVGIERCAVARLIRVWIARGHHTMCVAVVGANPLAESLIAKFRHNSLGIHFIGVFDDRNRDKRRPVAGIAQLGTIADLLEYSRVHGVDLVVVTLPIAAAARIQHVLRQLRQQPLNVRLLPGPLGLDPLSPIRIARAELPGVQLMSVADRPISDVALFAKQMMDRGGAAAALLLFSPVLLACVIGIKLCSPGPVLFRQPRIGFKGRPFDILKLRTMHVAAQAHTELTRRDDARVYKFGSLLRRTSLDELPQLINVLRGDMSLVGPRPHMPQARAAGALYFDAVAEYADRHRVKPGITGWAQVNGWRGPTETVEQIERRVAHDIYYIDNWSLFLDVAILAKTVLVGFHGKNAF